MNTRIELLIKSLGISPSQFADEINVQRSSVSHVLSGRNKPSLDFVTKIINRYPELNTDWILTGRGTMYGEDVAREKGPETTQASLSLETDTNEKPVAESEDRQYYGPPIEQIKKAEKVKAPSGPGSLEKIVFFYSDGHFKEYKP